MKRIVIIGGGFAGTYCARNLQDTFDVTLIDTKDYFEFTPAVLRSLVEPEHAQTIEVTHTSYLTHASFVKGHVNTITASSVEVNGKTLAYDYLIIATGSRYNTPIKEENLVITSRARELKEYAQKLKESKQVLIIGGGIVGVELAAEIITHYPHKHVTIVHAKDKILERSPHKAIDYATKWLTQRNVEIIYNERVEECKNQSYCTKAGRVITADLAFWCTGIIPNGELMHHAFKSVLSENKSIKVNSYLQVEGHPHIFAAGDIASIPEEKLAQNAELQATIVVKNINHLESQESLEEYQSSARVMVISLGKHDGILISKQKVITGIIPGLLKSAIEWKEMRRYRK